MKLLLQVTQLLWPSTVLAGLWLVVSLVAFWYTRSTRRPIFLFSGLGALLMMVGQFLSPVRLAYHYVTGTAIPGGQQGRVELLVGAYKYQIAIEAMGALLFLVGLVREVMLARLRARANAARAAETATTAGAPVAGAGLGNAALVASLSPIRKRSERVGFSSGRTGQVEIVASPLAPPTSTERELLPPLSTSESEQPCPRCHAMLSADAQFCGNCGMQLEIAGTPPFSDELTTYR